MIRVDGADDFRRMGQLMKGTTLEKPFRKALRQAANPIIKAQRKRVRALTGAPTEWRKSASRRTRLKTQFQVKKRLGIRILTSPEKGKGPYARYMNRGQWRHPLWGNRDHWYPQQVHKGWFDEPADKGKVAATRKMILAMEKVVEDLNIIYG